MSYEQGQTVKDILGNVIKNTDENKTKWNRVGHNFRKLNWVLLKIFFKIIIYLKDAKIIQNQKIYSCNFWV